MDDLVSRSYLLSEYDRQHKGAPGGARKIIEEAPSAQKTGEWIIIIDINPYYTTWRYGCSECSQYPLRDVYEQEVLSDYCPNCGARMEVE